MFVCLTTFKALIDSLHLGLNPFLLLCNTSLYGIILYCFLSKCFITNSVNEPLGVAKCVLLHAGPWERIMEQIHCKQPQLACKQGSLTDPPCLNRWDLKTETPLNSGPGEDLEGHQKLQSWEHAPATWPHPDPTHVQRIKQMMFATWLSQISALKSPVSHWGYKMCIREYWE